MNAQKRGKTWSPLRRLGDGGGLVEAFRFPAQQELEHDGIDLLSIAPDLPHPRASDDPAPRARVSSADGLVVRIEKISVGGIEGPIAGQDFGENEGLEKPGGMGEMPLG